MRTQMAFFPIKYDMHFYHWTVETLERYLWLAPVLAADPDIKLFGDMIFIQQMLEALPLGMRADRIVSPGGRCVFVRRLLVTSYGSQFVKMFPSLPRLREVARMVSEQLGPKNLTHVRPSCVYVLRHGVGRNLQNEAAVVELAQRVFAGTGLTVSVLDPGSFSLAKQIELWRRMHVAIGVTGSHFVGALFALPGRTIVELTITTADAFIYHMSAAMGHEHWYLAMQASTGGVPFVRGDHFADDYLLDAADLQRLERILRTVSFAR